MRGDKATDGSELYQTLRLIQRGEAIGLFCHLLGDGEFICAFQGLTTSRPYAIMIKPYDEKGRVLGRNVISLGDITRIVWYQRPFADPFI